VGAERCKKAWVGGRWGWWGILTRSSLIYFKLWVFPWSLWLLPAVLIGCALHSELIGVAIFISAIILQMWISGIAYLIKGGN